MGNDIDVSDKMIEIEEKRLKRLKSFEKMMKRRRENTDDGEPSDYREMYESLSKDFNDLCTDFKAADEDITGVLNITSTVMTQAASKTEDTNSSTEEETGKTEETGNFEMPGKEDETDSSGTPESVQTAPDGMSGANDFLIKLKKVPGVFTDKGLECAGSLELYQKVVGEFADTGASRADTIETYFEQEDYRNYTIQVHALKSAARIIGATALSQLAMALEEAGNAEDKVKINNATGELLKMYRELASSLENVTSSDENLPKIDQSSLDDALEALKEMVTEFDFDGVDSVMAELKKYKMPENFKEKYAKLKTLVAEVARDDILLLLR